MRRCGLVEDRPATTVLSKWPGGIVPCHSTLIDANNRLCLPLVYLDVEKSGYERHQVSLSHAVGLLLSKVMDTGSDTDAL